MASGRILNNPELGSDPHYTFIQEVCDTVADLKMNNDEFRLEEVLKLDKVDWKLQLGTSFVLTDHRYE